MQSDLAEILITSDAIERRVAELGRELARRYADGEPVLVIAIMHGCVLFLADLVRELPIPLDLEFVYCKSYAGAERGVLEFGHRASLVEAIRGRRVLLVDDIFDTGRTVNHLVEIVLEKGIPRRDVRIAVHDYKIRQYLGKELPVRPDYYCRKHIVATPEEDFWIHYSSHELVGLTAEEREAHYYTHDAGLRDALEFLYRE